MIEEVVDCILQAEDTAKQNISEAEAQASAIIAQAEVQAEQIRKQSAEQNKKYVAEQTQQADNSARQVFDDKLSQLNSQTDGLTDGYKRNVDNAVKIILDFIK